MNKKVLIVFLIFLITPLLASAINVTFPCPDSLSAIDMDSCPSQRAGVSGFLIRLYQFSLGISGILAVGMIAAGGVYYAASTGNPSKQSDARDMIMSAIWGIILLFGAYLVLKTVNPELVKLSTTSSGAGGTATTTPATTDSYQNPDREIMQLARQLISSGLPFSSAASCFPGYADAQSVIVAVSNGFYPYVCSADCSGFSGCQAGGGSGEVTLSKNLMDGLLLLKAGVDNGSIPAFTVSNLTGDRNINAASAHYRGRAADLYIYSDIASDWESAINKIKNYGVPLAKCEYRDRENSLKQTTRCSEMFPSGLDKHIHIQF